MQIEKLEFDAIRYNPELEGFEAAVRIYDAGHIFRYASYVKAPLNADHAFIASGLVRNATRKHLAKGHTLRSFAVQAEQFPALAA